MSAFLKGVLILLFVLVTAIIGGFIQSQTVTTSSLANCDADIYNDTTECQGTGTGSFLASVFDVAVTGFDDAPDIVNILWLTIMGILVVAAVIMIISRFIPLLGGES